MTESRSLILASSSPQRRRLLDRLLVPFTVVPSQFDEASIVESDSRIRAQLLAQSKALAVRKNVSFNSVIIAADTYFISQDNVRFEKPVDKNDALNMLHALSGQTLTCLTGFYYQDIWKEIIVSKVIETRVEMRDLSSLEIQDYVASQPVSTWSGGFSAAYEPGLALVASVEGSLTSFTHGLPLELVAALLNRSGFLELQASPETDISIFADAAITP